MIGTYNHSWPIGTFRLETYLQIIERGVLLTVGVGPVFGISIIKAHYNHIDWSEYWGGKIELELHARLIRVWCASQRTANLRSKCNDVGVCTRAINPRLGIDAFSRGGRGSNCGGA